MHRTQIYLQDDLYERLKLRSCNASVSISELIRSSLERDIRHDPVADAKSFFERLVPLQSFADTEPETYVRELRNTSRLLRAKTDNA